MASRAYLDGGLSIIPINKKKRPASWLLPQAQDEQGALLFWKELPNGAWTESTEDTGKPKGTWEPYQVVGPTLGEVLRWLDGGIEAIALVCGGVSGGVEILDFDNEDGVTWYERWATLAGDPVAALGLPLQRTGGDGYQVAWRCAEIGGNQKLAWAAPSTARLSSPKSGSGSGGKRIMIETRGEGGYALLPPSLHPSGKRYTLLAGKFSQIPMITPEQRAVLLDCARQLSEVTVTAKAAYGATYTTGDEVGEVWAKYNQSHSIEEALSRYGYTHAHGNRWSRPGKPDSAGVHVGKDGKAYAHSSNDPMVGDRMGDNRPFSAFDLFAHFSHGDDYAAAALAAAIELGIEQAPKLHTLLYVEGYDNAQVCREVMFPLGWVVRGFRPDRGVRLDDYAKYPVRIVWGESWRTARGLAGQVPGAIVPVVTPGRLTAAQMARDGILQDYLLALRADAERGSS